MRTQMHFAVAAGVLLAGAAAFAGTVEAVNKNGDGVALKGYDPVAYFAMQKPMKGSPEHSFQWMGATWLFSSAANRDTFAADPERYAPRYGGYCAYAVSQGHTANGDPEAWRVLNGRLYLNYSKSVQMKWEQDAENYIRKADTNWPGLHR